MAKKKKVKEVRDLPKPLRKKKKITYIRIGM